MTLHKVGDDLTDSESPPEVEGTEDQPTDLSRRTWGRVLKNTGKEFRADNLTDLAAALTYYGVLAIFPALIVIVSVLGLLGHSVTDALINNLAKLTPGSARSIFTGAVHNIQSHSGPRA